MAKTNTKPITQAAIKMASIQEEDLKELEDLKMELLSKVDQSKADGRLYMMGQYTRMVALVAPEIKRIRDRFDRETIAAVRKEFKLLKAEQEGEDTDEAEKEA